MPITDAVLAHQASAGSSVIFKHLATALFLIVTFGIFWLIANRGDGAQQPHAADAERWASQIEFVSVS